MSPCLRMPSIALSQWGFWTWQARVRKYVFQADVTSQERVWCRQRRPPDQKNHFAIAQFDPSAFLGGVGTYWFSGGTSSEPAEASFLGARLAELKE